MAGRTDKPHRREYSCGLELSLEIVGGKWKVLLIWDMAAAPRRFGELRRNVRGISEKILIAQLRELVTDGVVKRRDFKTIPPHVEYSLTPFGLRLKDALVPLCQWGEEQLKRIGATLRT